MNRIFDCVVKNYGPHYKIQTYQCINKAKKSINNTNIIALVILKLITNKKCGKIANEINFKSYYIYLYICVV